MFSDVHWQHHRRAKLVPYRNRYNPMLHMRAAYVPSSLNSHSALRLPYGYSYEYYLPPVYTSLC